MSRLVADTLELQDPSAGYYFEIRAGGLDGHPTVRGEDVTIPSKAGRTAMTLIADVLDVTLYGIVVGDTAQQFRANMDALRAIFDPAAEPFVLTIHAPLHGLSTGETASLNVRFLRFVSRESSEHFRIMDIECVCIDDPPAWAIT
jgi:hypothetical protein